MGRCGVLATDYIKNSFCEQINIDNKIALKFQGYFSL